MKFIEDGPEIPADLLKAHEEGKLIFFCGAGISYPAGLPGFKDLVEKIYKELYTRCTDEKEEETAFKGGNYDVTLNLLEKRYPHNPKFSGMASPMRRAISIILRKTNDKDDKLETHKTLLKLGSSNGVLRLVTTNFDRLFHEAAQAAEEKFREHSAPTLPRATDAKWKGLVFLHGVLPENDKNDEGKEALNHLVITSSDFGLAYLWEGWAIPLLGIYFEIIMYVL